MSTSARAHKAHGHKVSKGSPATASYTAAPAPSQGPQQNQMSQAGTKALQFRAKKELAPLADPTQSIVE